jgi:predicted deacylase
MSGVSAVDDQSTIIQPVIRDSGVPGPKLLVLGAVHGDEPCGRHGIMRVVKQIDRGHCLIKKGCVTFVPVCNPRAYEAGMHYIDDNLNRIISYVNAPQNYEQHCAQSLIPYIDACDVLLDIHSYEDPDPQAPPFVFLDETGEEASDFTKDLGVRDIFTGWPELYNNIGDYTECGTNTYAIAQGKIAVTVECGTNNAPQSTDIAEQAIMNALSHLEMISANVSTTRHCPRFVKIHDVIFKKADGQLASEWKHLDWVTEGTVLAQYDNGETVSATCNAHIIMPTPTARVGDEWLWLGEIIKSD